MQVKSNVLNTLYRKPLIF